MKICKKCGLGKDETEFRMVKKPNGKTHLRNSCKRCCLDRKLKENNPEARIRANVYQKDRQREVKQQMVDYKGEKCSICGYNKCLAAMDFHHLDPSLKEFSISAFASFDDRARRELDKCILVCSNCHDELHYLNS